MNLAGLAAARLRQQDLVQAARLLGAAAQRARATSSYSAADERAEHERAVADVRAQLDEVTFAAAWEAGRTLTLEHAVGEALQC